MRERPGRKKTKQQLIEEQRQVSERLQASEESFRLMVDSLKCYSIAMLDPQGLVVSWNTGAQRVYGYEASEIIGQSFARFYPQPDVDAGKPQQHIQEAIQSGRHEEDAWRVCKNGSTYFANASLVALHDHAGNLRGFVHITRDMTERRRSEQAVHDTAAQLQAVINTAVDGIIAIDERGIVEWLNPAAISIFGYAANEVVGNNVSMLMPEPYHSEHDRYMANYLRTGQRKIIGIGREVQGRRKDGSVFPLDLAVSECRLGNRRMFTGLVRDITQRKEAEHALLAAKETAEAASKAKDHFLAVVSHELRTPLTPILATANLLQRRSDLPPEVLEDLGTIRRNAEHEARLVDDLLNLTRLSRGKIELHHEVVDAHAAIRNSLTQFQSEIDAKNIELVTSLRAKQCNIWADPGRIQQVFSNLLSNAIKFTPDGGRISVRSANIDDKLHLEFSDTGIGIEPDVLPRLFNAFEQGERTVTRKYGGLGLGLAIAKGMVDLHHGTLVGQSEGHGKGATFILEFETIPAIPAQLPSQLAPGRTSGPKRKILLVEDHPDTLLVVTKLLRANGYDVITATNVKEALALTFKEQFDLLISDIGLPDGSGLDIMRSIKDRLHVRGVALTGFGQEEDLRRSREAGFAEHLVKPVNFQLLESVIHRLAS